VDVVGYFEKHLSITREKLSALKEAYQKRRYTVVGDLGYDGTNGKRAKSVRVYNHTF